MLCSSFLIYTVNFVLVCNKIFIGDSYNLVNGLYNSFESHYNQIVVER